MKYKKYIKRFLLFITILILLPILVIGIAFLFYKKELAQLIISSVETTYGLAVQTNNVSISLFDNWPNASIKLNDVKIKSVVTHTDKPFLFQAKSLSVAFDLSQLVEQKITVNSVSIKHASINLLKDKLGVINYEIYSIPNNSTTDSPVSFKIKKVNLEDVKLDITNNEKHKHIGILLKQNLIKVTTLNESERAHITGTIFVDELLFKEKKGPFLKNKAAQISLNAIFGEKQKSIYVDDASFIYIDQQKYNISAAIDFNKKNQFTLRITGKELDFKKGVKLLNTKIQSDLQKMSLKKTVDIRAIIIAQIGQNTEPRFYITIKGKQNNLTIGTNKIPYSKLCFNGYIFCRADSLGEGDLSKADIFFENVRGNIYNFPFTARIHVKDLTNPFVVINAKLLVEANKVKFKPQNDMLLKGKLLANVNYSGYTYGLNVNDFVNPPMKLDADIYFNNLSYQANTYAPAYTFLGHAHITNKDLAFTKLKLKTVGGDFILDGLAQGFTKYACGFSTYFNANLSATTQLFDLTSLLVETAIEEKRESKIEKKDVKKIAKSNFTFTISLLAKKLLLRKIVASDASAYLAYANNVLTINSLVMHTCEGVLSADATLHNFSEADAHVTLRDMNVKSLFEQFENFGQSTIEGKNLSGTISAQANVNVSLNNDFSLKPNSLNGNVKLNLKEGHLLNFEPLQNVSNYIFKKRNFEDITFSDLYQTFTIKGSEMTIDNLEIASNILNLFVDGTYNFNGVSNLNMRIPWNNLKKRGKNYIPISSGKDVEDVKGLKLNAYGLPNQIKIRLGNK